MAPVQPPPRRRCVLVFVRSPVAGTVKTRLAARLDPDLVLTLYRSMVEDTMETLAACDADIAIFFHPPDAEATLRGWLGPFKRYVAQTGDTLGARMDNAFRWAFTTGYDQALCVGTDIPEINTGIIEDAFSGLDRSGCAIGPSLDGGYYLIGFAAGKAPPEVFANDIAWGTETVFTTTAVRLTAAGRHAVRLPTLRDIDTLQDLASLPSRLRLHGHFPRRTMTILEANDLCNRYAGRDNGKE